MPTVFPESDTRGRHAGRSAETGWDMVAAVEEEGGEPETCYASTSAVRRFLNPIATKSIQYYMDQ